MEALSEQLRSLKITEKNVSDRTTEIKTMNKMSIVLVLAVNNK